MKTAMCRIFPKQDNPDVFVLCWYGDSKDISTFKSLEGREGTMHETALKLGFTHYFVGATSNVRPIPTQAAADEAYAQSTGQPTRTIVTNDWQLRILRTALVNSDAAKFSAPENYEVGMLVGMIDDVLKTPSDEKMIHGFVL